MFHLGFIQVPGLSQRSESGSVQFSLLSFDGRGTQPVSGPILEELKASATWGKNPAHQMDNISAPLTIKTGIGRPNMYSLQVRCRSICKQCSHFSQQGLTVRTPRFCSNRLVFGVAVFGVS